MKAKNIFCGLLMVCSIFLTTSVFATVIEFTGMPADQDGPWIEGGFSIEAPTNVLASSHLHGGTYFDGVGFNVRAQMANDTAGVSLISATAGQQFDLQSLNAIDVKGLDEFNLSSYALQIDGIVNGAVQASRQLATDETGVIDFLGAGWQGLDEVQFWYASAGSFGVIGTLPGAPGVATNDNFEFDSLTVSVSAVPVPAAVWLFLTAVSGLGIMRKKQMAA